jgi:hypothetical protein
MQAYWRTLNAAGIDAARLASFDRAITNEPSFSAKQCPQLRKDLEAYLVTLNAVHGGHDLHSAALAVLGYSQVARSSTVHLFCGKACLATPCSIALTGSMQTIRSAVQVKRKGRSVHVEPVPGFNTDRLRTLVQALLALKQPCEQIEPVQNAGAESPRSKMQLVRTHVAWKLNALHYCHVSKLFVQHAEFPDAGGAADGTHYGGEESVLSVSAQQR